MTKIRRRRLQTAAEETNSVGQNEPSNASSQPSSPLEQDTLAAQHLTPQQEQLVDSMQDNLLPTDLPMWGSVLTCSLAGLILARRFWLRKLRPDRHPHQKSLGILLQRNSSSSLEPPFWISFLYGFINMMVCLPITMSFAAIIYRNPAFGPYMPVLINLTIVSGFVHQFCFSAFSSLPFAMGNVQDAGLMFLSSMATSIVQHCQEKGYSDPVLLATTTVCLSLATAVMGISLWLIGKCGLAQYVQRLPTSVIGGYLAFIGFFCGLAGISIMSGQEHLTLAVLPRVWIYILPGVAGGVGIYLLMRRVRHMAVLPCSMVFLLVAFYVAIWATHTSIDQATIHTTAQGSNELSTGWIRATTEESPDWTRTWDYVQWNLVAWEVLPRLVWKEVSMIFVVAISSSLDVAAIELEVKKPLNYNSELQMVGLSNVASGLTGGYSGSYIFSQTIFSLRAGITTRTAGFVSASCQLAFFLLPFSILAYIPNLFFGSLLCMISVDLLYDWLWDVRHKVSKMDFFICLSTFNMIQIVGVEWGIVLGIVMHFAMLQMGFAVGTSKTKPFLVDKGNASLTVSEA